jgi:outer membrane lipopolysaccharide assembly protein LptE/RlpB
VKRPLAILALLASASCGFHLAGSDVRTGVDRAYVQAPADVEIAPLLSKSLAQSGVTVLEAPEPQAVKIELVSERETRRTVTTTPQAQAADYSLAIEVAYRIFGPNGVELVPNGTAQVAKVVPVDRNNLVGSRQQETLVHGEMQRELVRQIMMSLAIVTRQKAH